MNVIIVDDERLSIYALEDACREIPDITVVQTFTNPLSVAEYVRNNPVDIAFLDIEMPGINGIDLADELHRIRTDIFVVFITGFKEYAFDAFGVDAAGYIMKPFDVRDIEKILSKINYVKSLIAPSRVTFRTFGFFDMFVNDTAVNFKSEKAKELLAFLIDRQGATASMEQIIDRLWPDEPYDDKLKGKYRKACMYLKRDLQAVGLDELIVSSRARLSVNIKLIDCDYYRFLDGDRDAIISFSGEYMYQYSWAEFTLARLEAIREAYLGEAPAV